ncbi:MAG TPA: hypothetical protein VGC93_20145 [Thermoanaerobaculia bacterium]
MRRWTTLTAALAVTMLLAGAPAFAQNDDDEYDDDRDDFALAVGVGLVEPGGDVETYFMAALRFAAGRDEGRGYRQSGGIDGYLEPEVGYWEDGDSGASDLLAGVNLVGVLPLGAVDSFFGVGAGVHWIDAQLLGLPGNDTETKFGANAQFGIDLYISESWSAFGAGRYDLVQDAVDDIQGKIYLGLRGRW